MIFALPHTMSNNRIDGMWSLFKKPQMELGECYHSDKNAVLASYVRFAEDVKQGDALKSKLPLVAAITVDVSTDGNIVAGSDEISFDATTNLATLVSDDLMLKVSTNREYAYLKARAGSTTKLGIVTEFTTTKLTIVWSTTDGRLDAAFTADTTLNLSAPWLVEKAGDSDVVVGFAQRDAKKKDYGLVLVQGSGYIQAGAATGIGAGDPLRPSGDGELDEEDAVTSSTIEDEPAIATALVPADADGEVIWGTAYCKPISKIMFMPEGYDKSFERGGDTTLTV